MTGKNTRLFYILSATNNTFFVVGNWIFFWLRFMSESQLGWLDAIAFGFGLLMEVPTGAVADLLGRKRTVQVGMFLCTVGILGVSFSNSLSSIFVSWMLYMLGLAFYSGAAEALVYDSLVAEKKESAFDDVMARASSIGIFASVVGALVGAYLYIVHFRLPHLIWGLSYFASFLVSLFLVEPKIKKVKFSINSYFSQLFQGVKELWLPQLRKYSVFFIILLGVYYLYDWGLVRPAIATSFGFDANAQSIIYAFMTMLCAILVKYIPSFRKVLSDFGGLVLLALFMGAGFFMAYFPVGNYGLIALLLIAISGYLSYPWISIIVNKEISSKYRATTLSTVALISKIPYVFFAVLAGSAWQSGKLSNFNLGVAIAVFTGVVLSIVLASRLKKLRARV